MNISSEISPNGFNVSGYFFLAFDFHVSSVMYIICILLSFPINSYVIWLIVTGTGNGLAAEFFILNLSVCEILLCVQTPLLCLNHTLQTLWIVVLFLDGIFITGRPLFQSLICVERYLAVVHPVTFLKYKPLRYRLMCSAVAWVATFATGGLNVVSLLFVSVSVLYFIVWWPPFLFFLCVQLFCCLAVLRALKQSGPGERGRERKEENHMKKRAFYFILITTVTTVILYVTYFVLLFLPTAENVLTSSIAEFCFTLSGLVQPVLFLYRVGKQNFIKCQ